MTLALTNATISTTGNQLTLTFNESVNASDGGITLSASGGPVTVSIVGSAGNSVFYSMSREILESETVLLNYIGTSIQDSLGNALSPITNRSVTNLSEIQGPSPKWTITLQGDQKCEAPLIITVTTASLTVTITSNDISG